MLLQRVARNKCPKLTSKPASLPVCVVTGNARSLDADQHCRPETWLRLEVDIPVFDGQAPEYDRLC